MDRRSLNSRNKSISSSFLGGLFRGGDSNYSTTSKTKNNNFNKKKSIDDDAAASTSKNKPYSNIIDSILSDSTPKHHVMVKEGSTFHQRSSKDDDYEHNSSNNKTSLKKIILEQYDSIMKQRQPNDLVVLPRQLADDASSISSMSCYLEENNNNCTMMNNNNHNNEKIGVLDDFLLQKDDSDVSDDCDFLWESITNNLDEEDSIAIRQSNKLVKHSKTEMEDDDDAAYNDDFPLDDEESLENTSILSLHDYNIASDTRVADHRRHHRMNFRFLGGISHRMGNNEDYDDDDCDDDSTSNSLGGIITAVLDKEFNLHKNFNTHDQDDEQSFVSSRNQDENVHEIRDAGNNERLHHQQRQGHAKMDDETLDASRIPQDLHQERYEAWQELVAFIITESRGGDLPALQWKGTTNADHQQQQVDEERYNQLLLRLQDYRTARSLRRDETTMMIYPLPYGMFGIFYYVDGIRIDLEWADDAAYRRKNGKPFLSYIDFVTAMEDISKGKFCFGKIPWFTVLLLIVSTVMLVASIFMNGGRFEPFQNNPMLGPSVSVLLQMGAVSTMHIVEDGEWSRLVLGMVLHAGCIHWLFNMSGLILIGPVIEYIHGSAITATVFMFSALGGNLLTSIFSPYQISMGASGGLCALMGMCLVEGIVNWKLLSIQDEFYRFPYKTVIFSLVVEITLLVVMGLTPYVDQFAHFGGLFFGMCFSCIFVTNLGHSGFFGMKKPSILGRLRSSCWRLTAFALALSLLMSTTIILLQSDGDPKAMPCPKCRSISCVPFPFWKPDIDKWWNCNACDYIDIPYKLHQTSSTDDKTSTTIYIDLACPDGDIVTADVGWNNYATTISSTDSELSTSLVRAYCRDLCDV